MVSILVSPSIFNANFKINIGFEVQPTFCATEVLDNAALPSVASGVSAVTLKAAQDEYQATSADDVSVSATPQIHWLIQRYNGKTQDRCKLLKPQAHSPNKIDATLLALTHFFWNEYRTDEVMSHYQSMSSFTMIL
jgi:hypothetical protein